MVENERFSGLAKLTFDEKEILRTLSGYKDKEIKKEKRILPVKEWLDSEYYSGSVGKLLYPYWKKHLIELFDNEKINYNELIITGALSTGKTFYSEACWLRLLYIFSQTKDLQQSLGLMPHSRILLAYLSVSITEAELSGFGEFRTLLDSIPYFQEQYPRNPHLNSRLEFPNGVTIVCGSDVLHFIGTHLFSLIFDESNFTKTGGGKPGDLKKAFNIYESSTLRIKTRYAGKDIKHSGLNILMSSSTHKTSFTEQTIKMAKNNPGSKIIVTNLIECKPKGTFSDERFLFYLGEEDMLPKIIENVSNLRGYVSTEGRDVIENNSDRNLKSMYKDLPIQDRQKFFFVPEEFKRECTHFPEAALRDILGFSQSVSGDLLDNKQQFYKCVEEGKSFGLRHPFSKEVLQIGIKDNVNIIDFLDKDYLIKITEGRTCYIHLDQSGGVKDSTSNNKLDATGIGMSMVINESVESLKIAIPLMLRIDVPIGDKISISKCRQFVEDLINIGINIENVTYDSYNSTDSIQILESKGIKAGRFSADRDDSCWLKFVDLVYNLRVIFYDYPIFEEELFALKHDRVNRKVDHSLTGSKDICDSVISSVYQLWLKHEKYSDDSVKVDGIKNMLGVVRDRKVTVQDLASGLLGDRFSIKSGVSHKSLTRVGGSIVKSI